METARAETDSLTAARSDTDQDLARIETYLNGIKSLRADFIQVAPDGSISDGRLYLDRPGRVRFDYNPPSRILVVSSGKWISLVDYEIGDVSRWPVSDTPFRILVDAGISLGGNIDVAALESSPGILGLTVFNARDPKQGSIKLVFARTPLRLRQWEVTDPQGLVTKVGLTNLETNVKIDPDLFTFEDPRPRTRRRRR